MRKIVLILLICLISMTASAQVKSLQDIALRFETYNSLGAYQDADSLPTANLYINSLVNGATVAVTNTGTGTYTATVTLPALLAGDIVQVKVNFTMDTVSTGGEIFSSVADTYRVSDLVPYLMNIGQATWNTLINDLTVDDTVGKYVRAFLKEGKIGG